MSNPQFQSVIELFKQYANQNRPEVIRVPGRSDRDWYFARLAVCDKRFAGMEHFNKEYYFLPILTNTKAAVWLKRT